jgi:hypothetical protein
MPPAQASLHTYRERPGQVTVRSQQSLRDARDRAWQAVAFKRWQQGQYQGTYLRLVGFPGGDNPGWRSPPRFCWLPRGSSCS